MKTTTTKTNTLLFSRFAGWLALFVLLLSGLSTNAQVYLPREGFESAFTGSPAAPPGWTQQLIRNVNVTSTSERDWVRNQYVSGSIWTIDGWGTEPNAVAPGSLVGELGALYIDDGNFNAGGNQIRRLISPTVNLSASTNPHIRFQYHYANANTVLNFRVMASNDGTNWTLISTPVAIGVVNAWRGINVLVPAAFRTSTARFALDVTATFGSNGVFVDNFIIEEFTPTVNNYTGASGGNWFVPGNWSLGVIPTADHSVVIPNATVVNINTSPAPIVTSAVAYNLDVNGTLQFSTTTNVLQVFNDLTVGSTGTYISGSATVGTATHVGRNVTVNAGGTLNFANGTANGARLVFNGGSPATYTNNGTLTNTRISNISFANGGGVSFASAVAVRPGATLTTSTVQLVAGAVNGTNLTLGNSGFATNTQLLEVLDGSFSVAPTYDATNVTARNLSYLASSSTLVFRTFRQGYVQTAGLEFPAILPGTLVLNTHNNISITSNRQVNATITFTRGLLLTGANEFIVGAGATPGAGTSPSVSTLVPPTTHGSYVVGNIRYISPATGTGTRNVPLGVGSSLYTGSALDNRLVLSSVNPGTGGWFNQEFVISTFSAATGSPSAPIQTLFGNVGVRFQEVVGTLPSTFAFTWRANRWLGSTPANDDNNSDQLTVGDRSNLAVVQSTTPTGGTWTRRSLLVSAGDASNSFSTGTFADNTEYLGQTAVTGAAPGPITPFSTNGEYFILGSTASSGLAVGTVSAINTPTTGMSWGAPDQTILRVDIPVSGLVGAQTLNALTVNYTGTSLSDVSGSPTAVKLWRTTGTTFTGAALLQSQAAASTVNFTGIGANLPVGTSYFWITIDVSTTPTPANVVDFEVPALGLTINESGGAQAYAGNALLAPTGSRPINAASPYNITLTTGVPFTSIMSTGSTFASWIQPGSFGITDEGISSAVTLPFPFTYFGTSVTSIRAYTNGFLTLDGAGASTTLNTFSPRVSSTNTAGLRAIVAPFWDDLTTFVNDNSVATMDASVRYETVGTSPNRRFIVEWAGVTKFAAPGPDLNFQVVLHENGNRIEFIYGNMTGFNGTGNVAWSYQTGINSFSTVTHTPASLQKLEVPDVQQFGTSTTNLTKVPDCYISYLFDPASNYLSGPGAPALPNDECASGINLGTPLIEAPSELCDVYYSAGATASSGVPVCSAPTPGTPDDDVWFTFTTGAVGTADYAVTVYPSNVYDAAVQVFSGTCGSLTPITCVNANGNGLTEIANLPGLAQNTTYRVRVYHAATGVGTSNGSFSIAVTRVFPAPANNECAGATVLTPGVTCSPTSGTTLGANTSVGIPVCSVAGTVADDDVFFTFTATQTIHEVRVQGLGTFNPVVQIFSGACGSLAALNCVNNTGAGGLETVSSNAFVIGQTYTIRVYHSGLGTASGNFTICVVSPPPPANDNCTGALLLANGSSCVNTSASGFGSTASAQAACGGNPDDDVWFRFVATNTYAEITVTGSTNYNPHIEVFNGGAGVGNCATMTSIACDDSDFGTTESTSLTGLTIGNSYFVRVYHTGTYVGTSSGNFQICVFTPPPPSNDNCNTSINVVPSTTTTCVSSVTSNVFLATASGPAGCDGTADDDIWFRFTADYPEAVINATTAYDCVIEFFVGNCFGLTSAVCEDLNFGGNETMFLTNLTVGETYYFRVYSWSSTPQTFSAGVTTVCITRPPPPSNDECAGAVSLTVGASCVTTTGSGYGATQSLAPATCSGFTSTDAKDVWFTFNVTTPGVHNIEVQASGINTEPIVELFSGTCGTLSSISCSDATINGGREIISQNLSAGVHFVRVYNFGPAGASNFTICVNTATLPAPPANDNPNNAIALTPVVSCGFDGPFTSTGATMTFQTSTASNDDVWFTFPAPSYSFQIRVQGSGGYDPVFRVFTFNELAPGIKTVSSTTTARDTSGVNGLERFTLFGYTTGEPVYVQVYAFGTGAPSGSFTICAQINPPPPNDDCANATLLTQNLGCTPTAGNTLEATDSGVTPPSCPGSPDDDVWYRFVATTTNPIIRVQGTNNFNAVVEFRGTGPCSGTSVTCVNNTGNNGVEQINLSGLTVGTTYYFRVYSAGSANSDQGTFTVCVRNAIPQGATCANPLVLAVNAAPVNFTGNSAGYDNDLGAQTSTCSSLYGTNGEDVVFQLNVGSPGQRIISVTNTSGTNNIGWFLKSNVNCATTSASLACAVSGTGPTAQAIFNFPSSGTYFLIVDYLTIVNSGFTLDIIPLPTNDDPCTATPVTFSTSTPTIISATNLGATNGTFGPGTCSGGSFLSDVWFRTTLPAGVTSIAVNTLPGSNSDVIAEMFTAAVNGDCNTAFTNIACNDDGGPGLMSWAAASNLTPGTVVFIRISSYGTGQGAFQFAVTQGQVWLGNVSNSWTAINSTGVTSDDNWFSRDVVPNSSTVVVIPNVVGAGGFPAITTTANVQSLIFARVGSNFSGANVTVNSGSLNFNAQASENSFIRSNTSVRSRINGPGFVNFLQTGNNTYDISNIVEFGGVVAARAGTTVNSGGNMVFINNSSLLSGNVNRDGFDATGNVTGNIRYQRTGSNVAGIYNYWSSPVSGAPISVLNNVGLGNNIYLYDNTRTGANTNVLAGWEGPITASSSPTNTSAAMIAGKGYIQTAAGNGSVTFTGAPRQTNATIGVTTNGGNNFNLVGNPYPSTLSLSQAGTNPTQYFFGVNTNVAGVYLWRNLNLPPFAGAGYVTMTQVGTSGATTPGGYTLPQIGAAQGFMVAVNAATAVNFNGEMRLTGIPGNNPQFLDVNDFSTARIRLYNAEETQSYETMLAFKDDATDGIDHQQDAQRFPVQLGLEVFTVNGDNQFVIQALPTLHTGRIIPLGTQMADANATYKIRLTEFANFDATTRVYIEDLATGAFHNLSANNTYEFVNMAWTGVRFKLHFRAPIAVSANGACAGEATGKLIVNNPNPTPASLTVKNAEGMIIAQENNWMGDKIVNNMTAGNYTINVAYEPTDVITRNAVIEAGSLNGAANFTASAYTVSLDDATVQFTGINNGANSITWDFGDGQSVSGVLNPVHTYTQAGQYTVTLTTMANGCGSSTSKVINVGTSTVGIGSIANQNSFSIYPNPSSDIAYVLLNMAANEKDVMVSIIDNTGRLVSKERVNEVRNGSVVTLQVNGLANGIYEVVVENKNFRSVGKLSVAH